MAEACPKHKYLLETVSNCIRSCKVGADKTEFQMDDLNYDGL